MSLKTVWISKCVSLVPREVYVNHTNICDGCRHVFGAIGYNGPSSCPIRKPEWCCGLWHIQLWPADYVMCIGHTLDSSGWTWITLILSRAVRTQVWLREMLIWSCHSLIAWSMISDYAETCAWLVCVWNTRMHAGFVLVPLDTFWWLWKI